MDDEMVGTVYAQLRFIRAQAAGVCLTSVASCYPEVVEIQTLDTWLLIRFSLVHD